MVKYRYMSYSLNPNLPKVRKEAVNLVKVSKWSIRKTSKYLGYSPSTISRWCNNPLANGWNLIPTKSSRPKTNPKALKKEIVVKIINTRLLRRRCSEHIHKELANQGLVVSLSSVKRTLARCHLLKKRSPWKRSHDYTLRPEVNNVGDLVQIDTIHIMTSDVSRIYVYTLIDLYSRWAYAEVIEKISANESAKFVYRAQDKAPFKFKMIQSDNGSEFSTWFTHGLNTININHRHSRVRRSNDNAHIERFNRTIQEECLDRVPNKIPKFKTAIEDYLDYYNNHRTHMGINFQTPSQVLQRS